MPLKTLNSREDILELIPKNSRGIELGVLHGDFSSKILDIVKPHQLFLVDPWKRFNDPDHLADSTNNVYQQDHDGRYYYVANRFKKEIYNGVVSIMRKMSLEIAASFDDEFFDWIYLDANHSYQNVLNELMAYFPKVKSGGFILGDDFVNNGYYGVIKAVEYFCSKYPEKLQPIVLGSCNQFLLLKKK